MLRIHDILGVDLDPDPSIFVLDLQDASKKNNFLTQFFLPMSF
jgi:hypothetical protein